MTRDDAASTVIGAIIVLAVLSLAVVYVNAYHVPRQGAALELEGREETESSLAALAARLAEPPAAPLVAAVPVQPPPARPPLLSGVILAPARPEGRLAFDPEGPTMRVSLLHDAPPGGVPAGDPMRTDAGGGRMRVYLLGSATAAQPVGALEATTGGAYLEDLAYRVEAGAVLTLRAGASGLVSAPPLDVTRAGAETLVAWRVPLLAGDADAVAGAPAPRVQLAPGPEAAAGGGAPAHALRIEITTGAVDAWRAALQQALGTAGTVTVTGSTVTADVQPPAGVRVDLRAVRYAVTLG